MTRLRWAGLGAVVVLVVAALVVPQLGGSGTHEVSPKTRGLQAAAALAPCPTGLGAALPDLTVRCLGGGPSVRLRAPLTGGPTVVNVWGSWCAPCVEEVPALVRFSEAAQGKVALVGVNVTDVDDFALDFAAKAGMHYPSLVDADARISTSFGNGVPKTVLIDATGRVVHVQRTKLTYDELVGLVRQYLGVSV